jgi:hypothetical protein
VLREVEFLIPRGAHVKNIATSLTMERRSRLLCCAVFFTATIVLSVVTYILVFQSPDKIVSTATPYHVFENKERECANTFQGRTWITDDKGTKFRETVF